jgi:type II secretory pathway component GspD/PulD (secretin)
MKNINRKNLFLATGFICFSLIFIPYNSKITAQMMLPNPDVTISIDLQDANLKDVLKVFSMQSGLNFIASEAIQDRKITLYLDKVPVEQAMVKLFKANGLYYDLGENSNIIIVKDWGKPVVDTVTKIFYLKYATVSTSSLKEEMSNSLTPTSTSTSSDSSDSSTTSSTEDEGKWKKEDESGLTSVIKKLLSENGSLIEDYRTNSLIITDIPSRMEIISTTIAALDVIQPQVMLEVEMLDVNKNLVDKLGVLFGQSPLKIAVIGGTMGLGFPFKSWSDTFRDATSFGQISVNSGTLGDPAYNPYTATLDFLSTQNDTKYLARPRILTLNNETAEIKIATNESIGVSTTTEASTGTTGITAERAETGVILRVTPQINLERGEITMFVNPQVSEAATGNPIVVPGAAATSRYIFRDPEVRSTKSVVRIKDGETVIIGGLIRNDSSETITKLPFFGDIPILGALFRHKDKTRDRERELLVFITPHIIKENSNTAAATQLAEAKKVSIPEREQSTTSGVDKQKAITSSLNNFDERR